MSSPRHGGPWFLAGRNPVHCFLTRGGDLGICLPTDGCNEAVIVPFSELPRLTRRLRKLALVAGFGSHLPPHQLPPLADPDFLAQPGQSPSRLRLLPWCQGLDAEILAGGVLSLTQRREDDGGRLLLAFSDLPRLFALLGRAATDAGHPQIAHHL